MTEPPCADRPDPLRSSRIFRFFWPLALSWLFMSVEGPACVGLITRLPDAVLQVAAFNVLMALALFIESPVIDLLSTSTTLTGGRASYLTIRRFVVWLMAIQTIVHAGFVLTPAYDWVTINWMQIPQPVADAARTGLICMIPWSACIGWRRFHQGLLIRYGKTKPVGAGTFVRMAALFTTAFIFFVAGVREGATLAGLALIGSVFSEAIFAWWAARSIVAEHLGPGKDEGESLTMADLARFHFPLTATTMVMFIGGPMLSSALAQSYQGEKAMAAWQVASSLLWIFRAAVYALPEVVITLGRQGPQAMDSLRKFCWGVGLSCSALVSAFWLTKSDLAISANVLQAPAETLGLAHMAFALGIPLPFIAAAQSYLRGSLTLQRQTGARLIAIIVGVGALAASIETAKHIGIGGVETAAFSMIVALIAELAALWIAHRAGTRTLPTERPRQ